MASAGFPLKSLPPEIMDQIFSHLSQKKLHALLLTSTALSEPAALQLYKAPRFSSTYRFAQFVTTVSHSSHLASMVRSFSLWDSHEEDNRRDELASWMEWKYRSVPLFAARPSEAQPQGQTRKTSKTATHPRCNQFLKKYTGEMGIPVGAIVHVLSACKNLRRVNLHFKSILKDFVVNSAAYPATATSSMVFVSDVPRSWTKASREVQPISTDAIIQYLTNLPHLEKLDIRNAKWLSAENVKSILMDCPGLMTINFVGSGTIAEDPNRVVGGPEESVPWAIKGSRKDVVERLKWV